MRTRTAFTVCQVSHSNCITSGLDPPHLRLSQSTNGMQITGRTEVAGPIVLVMSSLGLRSLRPLFRRHLSFASAYKAPRAATLGTGTLHRLRTMSRDVSQFSDISKSKTEADGSFKRAPSSFRNFIQAGGKFPPEKGTSRLELSPEPATQSLS